MTECEQFFGRLRDLCEGRGFDGRPHPPRHAIEQFRAHYGLAPLMTYLHEVDDHVTIDRALPDTNHSAIASPLPVPYGPGAELEELFGLLKVPYYEDCGCHAFARQMDAWGISGCRARADEIITRLRETAAKYSLVERLEAAIRAATSGLAFKLNPFDPFPGLLEEALRRAERERALKASPSPECLNTLTTS